MKERIGIIRSLYYYHMGTYWETFFTHLGVQPIYANCGREDLARKAASFENELCLPVKYFLVQARALLYKSPDFLFTPITVSLDEKVTTCPKIIMSGELIRLYHPILRFPGSPRLLSPQIAVKHSNADRTEEFARVARQLGHALNRDSTTIEAGIQEARCDQTNSEQSLYGNFEQLKTTNPPSDRPHILILGHRYSTHNAVLNDNLMSEIENLGGNPIFKEDVLSGDENLLTTEETGLPDEIYFSGGAEIFKAAYRGANNKAIDGILYLSMFNCGFDAMIEDVVSRRILKDAPQPFMNIVLDEHSTTTNLTTKLEVFMDMVASEGACPA